METAERKKQLERVKSAHEKDVINFRAMIGETEARINEIKKETHEFKRQVLVGGLSERTGRITSASVIRYYDNKLKVKDILVRRLIEKNSDLEVQLKSLGKELKFKEQSGESLCPIDFHQLEIENKTFSENLVEKNKQLLQLKASTAKLSQVLNDKKMLLNDFLTKSVKLRKQIKIGEKYKNHLTQDHKETKAQMARMKAKIKKLKQATNTSSDMPQVNDYVAQKAEEHTLRQNIKKWEKKVELAISQNRTRSRKKTGMGTTRRARTSDKKGNRAISNSGNGMEVW
jgi:hypothetical protein